MIFIFRQFSTSVAHPVNYVYHKMLLNENESYLVLVGRQILLATMIRHVTILHLTSAAN